MFEIYQKIVIKILGKVNLKVINWNWRFNEKSLSFGFLAIIPDLNYLSNWVIRSRIINLTINVGGGFFNDLVPNRVYLLAIT